jgi:hypothetical protein
MTVQEQNAVLDDIAMNLNDVGKVTLALAKLRKDYNEMDALKTKAETDVTNLTKLNSDLQQYNMQLFLGKGVTTSQGNTQTEITPENDNHLSFDGLDLSNFTK